MVGPAAQLQLSNACFFSRPPNPLILGVILYHEDTISVVIIRPSYIVLRILSKIPRSVSGKLKLCNPAGLFSCCCAVPVDGCTQFRAFWPMVHERIQSSISIVAANLLHFNTSTLASWLTLIPSALNPQLINLSAFTAQTTLLFHPT